jgi:threonylcarbamoyladenosine tRNA methylthiotransferase MtaB
MDRPPEPSRSPPPGDGQGLEAVTFGCRLNAHESDLALERARADGVLDAVLVNTCAVTAEAARQSRQAVRAARRRRPDAAILVTGCAAEIDKSGFAAMAEIDLLVANAQKTSPGAYRALSAGEPVLSAPPRTAAAPARARGYVAVQNGCDHSCTFCMIPLGRGVSRSSPMETVLGDVRTRLEEGLKEVVLTGVDITSWGEDLDGGASGPRLGDLVGAILDGAPALARLRLSSIDAAEIDPTLLRLFAEAPRLMPHLHLSLQAGDDLILKRMRRRHLRADALRLIEAVRRARPETAFGADLIAGFPTETEAMFQNTLSLIEEAGLAYVHVFPFSPRPGTPAARMPQLDRALVRDRAERLRAAADAALRRHLSARLGRVLPTLVEGPGRGRAEDFTEILLPGAEAPGALLDVRIEAVEGRRARGAPQEALAA